MTSTPTSSLSLSQTSGGSTFYIVIDYDKPVDEEGEQYETYFLGVVDEADLLAAFEAGWRGSCPPAPARRSARRGLSTRIAPSAPPT